MRPRNVLLTFALFRIFRKKSPKIIENPPEISAKTHPKPPKIKQKSQKIVIKIQDELRCVKKC